MTRPGELATPGETLAAYFDRTKSEKQRSLKRLGHRPTSQAVKEAVMSCGSAFDKSVPDRVLLSAVENAADEEGWASADEVRFQIDGKMGRGRWARTLYDHEDAGYLERRVSHGGYFWGLTESGCEEIYSDE